MAELRHIAIIMDGNGRWARKRGLPRAIGHLQGVESVRTVVREAQNINLKYLTLYTFSTENWRRPEKEVETLMDMLEKVIVRETPELHKNDVRINAIGRLDTLYKNARDALDHSISLTRNNKGLVLTMCLSYGGRSEIIDAVKSIIVRDREHRFDLKRFDENRFRSFLYDHTLPDPDLLIRTGAERRERISNFLLWQIAYTEIYFTKTLWPDFRARDFKKAVENFKNRERLFGRVQ